MSVRRSRLEDGFTLVELAVGATLALIVAAVGMSVLTIALRAEPETSSRAAAIQEARTMIDRLARELRQGQTVSEATATQLTLLTYVPRASCGGASAQTSVLCRVYYSCTAGTCTRREEAPDASSVGPTTTLVSGLSSSSVFSYANASLSDPCGESTASTATNPSYVCIRLSLPASGDEASVTLDDAVELRNWFQPSSVGS